MLNSVVCEIENYAIHDGPGIRTVVFLKGCPLSCLWCSNPETQRKENELYYNLSTCILCEKCIHKCSSDALTSNGESIVINRDKCTSCDSCVAICPTSSLKLVGKTMTVEEVFEEVLKETIFYRQSGGGVTVSGGEMLMNADFTIELFRLCKENYIHTAVETTGFGSFEKLQELSNYTDIFLFDLKHYNSNTHYELTGVHNSLILENITKLCNLNKKIILRIPLIPSLNDDEDNIRHTIDIAKTNGIREIHLLTYHTLGLDKYKKLQKDYNLPALPKHEPDYIETLKNLIENSGIKCIIGG